MLEEKHTKVLLKLNLDGQFNRRRSKSIKKRYKQIKVKVYRSGVGEERFDEDDVAYQRKLFKVHDRKTIK